MAAPSIMPLGSVGTSVTERQPSEPTVVLKLVSRTDTQTVCLPGPTWAVALQPCEAPAAGKTAPTSGREPLAVTVPADCPSTVTWTVTGAVGVSGSKVHPATPSVPSDATVVPSIMPIGRVGTR